jgi:hypothetical protein
MALNGCKALLIPAKLPYPSKVLIDVFVGVQEKP